mmetsp:Transcript_5152/g.7490  ORF Transcript_5152/g.7490 Transcript_5152/m.7490 type:complete len:139 (-) Transcript_5152:700-1116(-)
MSDPKDELLHVLMKDYTRRLLPFWGRLGEILLSLPLQKMDYYTWQLEPFWEQHYHDQDRNNRCCYENTMCYSSSYYHVTQPTRIIYTMASHLLYHRDTLQKRKSCLHINYKPLSTKPIASNTMPATSLLSMNTSSFPA